MMMKIIKYIILQFNIMNKVMIQKDLQEQFQNLIKLKILLNLKKLKRKKL